MRKPKKVTRICAMAMALGSCLLFTACPSPEVDLRDVVPESYGEWDGNYLYHGYMRSKTTGSDTEVLIPSVILDGTEYVVTGSLDTVCVGDNMYSCLSVESSEKSESVDGSGEESEETETEKKEKISSCLVRYNIREKATAVIYYGTEPDAEYIEVIAKDTIVLSDYDEGDKFFRIDMEGNILEENADHYADYTYCGVDNAYMYQQVGNVLSVGTWGDERLTTVYTMRNNGGFRVNYVCEDGVEGLRITEQTSYGNSEGLPVPNTDTYLTRTVCGLYFYDLKTGTLTTLVSPDEGKYLVAEGLYYMTADEKVAASKSLGTDDSPFEWEYSGEVIRTNCRLYKITASEAGEVYGDSLYHFDGTMESKDFLYYYEIEGGKIFFRADWVVKGRGCQGGGSYYCDYTLDLASGVLEEADYFISRETPIEGVACGKYVYRMYKSDYDVHYSGLAYVIERYDTETEKWESMQCWTYSLWHMSAGDPEKEEDVHESEQLEFRYSQEMWFQGGDYSVSPEGFTVRSY